MKVLWMIEEWSKVARFSCGRFLCSSMKTDCILLSEYACGWSQVEYHHFRSRFKFKFRFRIRCCGCFSCLSPVRIYIRRLVQCPLTTTDSSVTEASPLWYQILVPWDPLLWDWTLYGWGWHNYHQFSSKLIKWFKKEDCKGLTWIAKRLKFGWSVQC